MSELHFLSADALPDFLAKLAHPTSDGPQRRILVPQRQGKSVIFAPYAGHITLEKASVSPKDVVLPRCESLLTYQKTKDPEDLGRTTLVLNDTPEAEATVLFGCRPCDARGFAVLDRPYLRGPYQDPYYKARRDGLLVITQTCAESCSTCFCHWVGSGPADTEGSDIVFTTVKNAMGQSGYALQAVTERGRSALKSFALPTATDLAGTVLAAHKQTLDSLGTAPDLSTARQSMVDRFSDMDFWQKHSAACLACGACTYFCPTCYCFTITDEGDGMGEKAGRRLRTWDTCMASHYTREASGHNPRVLKAQRMRNRVSHKFSYYPAAWDKAFSCNGCGRCISQCPVHLDIRAIVLAAMPPSPAEDQAVQNASAPAQHGKA